MNRDPFLRLALVAACEVVVLSIIVLGHLLGWPAAAGVAVAAIALVAAVSTETTPPTRDELKEQLRPERPGHDEEGRPRGFRRIT